MREQRRTWKRAILERLIIYPLLMPVAGAVIFIGGLADRLLLFPNRHELPTFGAERVNLPFQGEMLEFLVDRDPEPQRYVLLFTGNGTRAEDIATSIKPAWPDGTEVWTMNYPGFGGSTGKAELDDLPPAGLTAFDHVHELAAGKPVHVAGISLGCTVAGYVASERPVATLLMENPPPVQSIIMRRYGWWNLWTIAAPIAWQVPAEMNLKKTLPKVTAPTVISIAMKDHVVPTKYQLEVAALMPNAVVLKRPGVGHDAFAHSDDRPRLRHTIQETFIDLVDAVAPISEVPDDN